MQNKIKTRVYLQLLERMVVDSILLPVGSIHAVVDVYGDKPVITINNHKRVIFSNHRYLSTRENRLYMQEVIIVRDCKVVSACGENIIFIGSGERLFVDGFSVMGDIYAVIDGYEYEIEDNFYMLYSDYCKHFVMQSAQYLQYMSIQPLTLSS